MSDDTDPQPPKRGRGRPPGSLNKVTQRTRELALASGELPHEFLLRVSRGELIKVRHVDEDGVVTWHFQQPDLDMRVKAAKDAAPYYAPKLSTVELIQDVSNEDLDQIIAESAAAAGISVSFGGEGAEGQGTADDGAVDDGNGVASSTGTRRPRVRVTPPR